MRTEITPGQTSDYEGYDADRIRENVEAHGGDPVIPMRRNRKIQESLDTVLYAWRNLVERCFNRLKHTRRLATRYDKTAVSFLGFIDIACIRLWLRHLPA